MVCNRKANCKWRSYQDGKPLVSFFCGIQFLGDDYQQLDLLERSFPRSERSGLSHFQSFSILFSSTTEVLPNVWHHIAFLG